MRRRISTGGKPIKDRLKAYRLLPILRAALVAHATEHVATKEIEPQTDAA